MAGNKKQGKSNRKRLRVESDPDESRSEHESDREEAVDKVALRDAQLRVVEAERLAQEREERNRELKAQLQQYKAGQANKQGRGRGGRAPTGRANQQNRHEAAAQDDAAQQAAPVDAEAERLLKIGHNRDFIRMAGRRCAVLHHPFMEPEFLIDRSVQQALPRIIKDLKDKLARDQERGSDSEDEDEDDPGTDEDFWSTPRFELAQPADIVREVLSHLPIELGKLWLNPSFQKIFRKGNRKMKSEAASAVANARHAVFKLTDEEFGERHDDRKRGPGAKALLHKNNYMLIPAEPDANGNPPPRSPRWFRHRCLLKACQVVLAGLSTAESTLDRASSKARRSRGTLWGLTHITPSVIVFTSIVVHFVLTGDKEFLPNSKSTNFLALWDKRMEVLGKHYRAKRADYDGMEKLYNKKVFIKHHKEADQAATITLGEEEQELENELEKELESNSSECLDLGDVIAAIFSLSLPPPTTYLALPMGRTKSSHRSTPKKKTTKDGKVLPGYWRCPDCAGVYSKQKGGVQRHTRSCKSREAAQPAVSTPSAHDPSQDGSEPDYDEDMGESIYAPVESLTLTDQPAQTRNRGANNLANYGEPVTEASPGRFLYLRFTQVPSDDSHFTDAEMRPSSPTNRAAESAPLDSIQLEDRSHIPTLGDADVWVRRHPASGQASSMRLFSDRVSEKRQSEPTTRSLIFPFQTLADLEQTEVFVGHRASNSHMNDQLALEQKKPQDPENPLTLRTAADVHNVLEIAVPADTQFKITDFDISFCGQDYTFRLRMRCLRALITRILLDPELWSLLTLYPEQMFIRNPFDGTPMRVWEETWHGDDWWNLQNKVGQGACILYLHLYADATKIATYGGLKVWPVYAWIGNIPSETRRKRKSGGAILVGLIPVVHKDKKLSKTKMAELCVKVYQQAMSLILEAIKVLLGHGEYFRCADGILRFFVGAIPVISADYEEMVKIAALLRQEKPQE
ncbi:hypothetical protein FRC09_013983 [Ceratobasidium sp. 395]|nr:hypothetical protein FRC09_013983 [Ceratobasidium sp. 395]